MLQTTLGKAFFKLNQQEREKVKKLIEIAFVVVKEELSFTKFVFRCSVKETTWC